MNLHHIHGMYNTYVHYKNEAIGKFIGQIQTQHIDGKRAVNF